MHSFQQGDVIWMDFNPQAGHEQAGRRPALVVSNSSYNATGALVMVCPITNTKTRHAVRPQLPDTMNATGCVLCDHARFVDLSARNAEFLERAPEELIENVFRIIEILIALDSK